MKYQSSLCMFRCLAIGTLLLLAPGSNAQKADFQWARLLTGFSNEDALRSATMDAEGNVIASYYRQDAQQPGPWRSNLVMKIDTSIGEVKWSHRQLPSGRGLATAHDGTIYVTGGLAYINDNQGASLGGSQTYFSSRGLATEGAGGGYLARLSAGTGTVELIRHFGTSLYVMPYYLAVAPDGDFVILGFYMRTAAQFGETTLPAPSTATTRNLFLVKLGPAGEVRWAKAFASTLSYAYMNGMAVDAAGQVIVSANIGNFSLDGTQVDQSFMAKFSTNGSLVWLKTDLSGTPRLDKDGNMFVSGYADNTPLLQKYNSNGERQWSVPASYFTCSAVDAAGNFIGAGSFRIGTDDSDFNSIHPGELIIGGTTLQTQAEAELFAAKFSAAGKFNWAVQTQGQDFAYRPWPDGTFGGAGYAASWMTPNFVFSHPERGVLVGGIVMGRTLFSQTLLEGVYKKDFQPETSFFIARVAEPASQTPALKIARNGSRHTLSWSSTFTGFLLESAESIPASSWTPVDGIPLVDAGENAVTVEAGSGAKFFRLRKQ